MKVNTEGVLIGIFREFTFKNRHVKTQWKETIF